MKGPETDSENLATLRPRVLPRVGVVCIGAALYAISLVLPAIDSEPFLGMGGRNVRTGAELLGTAIAMIVAGGVGILGGLLLLLPNFCVVFAVVGVVGRSRRSDVLRYAPLVLFALFGVPWGLIPGRGLGYLFWAVGGLLCTYAHSLALQPGETFSSGS